VFIPNWARIAALAVEDRLPVMYVLAVTPATDAEFVINLKAAQAINLSFPQPVLDQATEIIR
jgi:ABC-type uncharacterized transport system substrate-binding protein